MFFDIAANSIILNKVQCLLNFKEEESFIFLTGDQKEQQSVHDISDILICFKKSLMIVVTTFLRLIYTQHIILRKTC